MVGQRVQSPAHGHNPLEIMTQQDYTQHSITPPPELVQEWYEAVGDSTDRQLFWKQRVATLQAAQWGADQELEACCKWLNEHGYDMTASPKLRAVRRPKPPSLKEQALAILDDCSDRLDGAHENIIRQALEELPND